MTVFELIKEAVPITDAARRYGLNINSRGWALCPFHADKHPSMSFKGQMFKCFACNEGGDVIKLVQRLLGLVKSIDAAKELNAAYNLGLDIGGAYDPIAAEKRKRDMERLAAFEEWIRQAGITWVAYCRLLEDWKQLPMDDPRFVNACHRLDYADYIFETVFLGDSFKTQVHFYKTHAGEVKQIERILDQERESRRLAV